MTTDELIEEAVINWRNNKGVGTAFVPAPFDDRTLLYNVLVRIYGKTPEAFTIIIVENFNIRTDIIEFLTHQENEDNNKEFKNLLDTKRIKVFTTHFIISGGWQTAAYLAILYRPESFDIGIGLFYNRCKYRFTILNKFIPNDKNRGELYKITPLLECFKQAQLDEVRVSSPVEEMWIGVDIPIDSEAWKLYQYYCKYIETSINIFGSFDIMQQARVGNETLNISSASICAQIAEENGWHEHLDMSYEFNRSLDEMYNPNALRERATQTYEAIRNRSTLVSDYDGKLEKVLEIVKQNPNDKILIISKRGEFASKVTDYLNNNYEEDVCGNYHNKLDDIPAVDIVGNPVYIKSGIEKGKRKSMGYRAQMTLNEKRFNLNKILCLSTSNAPDKSLNIGINTVIITSPLCEDIKSYLYRLTSLNIISETIKLFSIFCKSTIEQQKLINKPVEKTHIIVNKNEIIAGSAENNGDFICVC